jgi:hypothetical protein
MGDRLVLPDRDAPLLAHVAPPPADLQTPFGQAGGACGQRQPASIQRGQRDLQAFAFLADEVLTRHAHVVEADDRIGERLEPHEAGAILDPDTGPGRFHDEGADLLRLRIAGHHHEQLGERAVRTPQLLAVEHIGLAVPHGGRGQARRVGANVRLGEREGRDRARRAAGQVLLLLLERAKELERLGHADRLMGGQQREHVVVVATDDLHHRAILGDREPEAAVFLRNLHPEGAERAQTVDDMGRVFPHFVDRRRVDVVDEKPFQLVHELLEDRPWLERLREGVHEGELELAEEEVAQESFPFPLDLSSLLGDLAGLGFAADVGLGRRRGHVRLDWSVPFPIGVRVGVRPGAARVPGRSPTQRRMNPGPP